MTDANRPDSAAPFTAPALPIHGVGTAPSCLSEDVRQRIAEQPLDWRAKGFPSGDELRTIADVRAQRPSLFDAGFATPIATLRASALTRNLETMERYCAASAIKFAPHGKTTMAPQIFDAQLAHGAWGITVATPHQARVADEFGVPQIFLANELVDPAGLAWVASRLADPAFRFLTYVDNPLVAAYVGELLDHHGAARPLDVVLEVGYMGGRTGTRSAQEADALAAAVQAIPQLRLVGVSGYEGGFGHSATDEIVAAVRHHLHDVRATGERLDAVGAIDADEVIVSAGSSSFFDLVAEELSGVMPSGRPTTTIIRSGGVISHDEGLYGEVSPFTRRDELRERAGGELETAVEVWSRVLSRPEPQLALLDVGKRDVPYDQRLPSIHRAYHRPGGAAPTAPESMTPITDVEDWEIVDTNDHHAYVRLPDSAVLAAGDLVALGITHPCTFFDKWRAIPVVTDDGTVTDVIQTYF